MKAKYIAITLLSFMMSACVAPTGPATGKDALKNGSNTVVLSTASIKEQEEQKYTQLLANLQVKNPQQDVKNAIARGDLRVLGYQSGRGGLKVPGLTGVQQNRCSVNQLGGMGDTIFGNNHLRYRVALRQYANQYNRLMVPNCR